SIAFKFGIYHRSNSEAKESSNRYIYGETYAWQKKFGKTEQEAFANVRDRLVQVIEATQAGNFPPGEKIDLSPIFKWKVAFLYQNRNDPTIIPIYSKDALYYHYKDIDPSAKKKDTPYYVMYETLLERHRDIGDLFDISRSLMESFNADRNR